MDVLTWLRQHFCQHNNQKHWSRGSGPYGGYVKRCTKCGKIAPR